MVSAFDQRIVKVGISFDNRELIYFEGLNIYASGVKTISTIQNQCDVRIYNLTREQRNFILTNASPYRTPRIPVMMTLDVGRESYSPFRLYQGYVIECQSSQPPDIGILMHGLTGNYLQGAISNFTQPGLTPLSVIAAQIAQRLGVSIINESTDKYIENFSFTGADINLVPRLASCGVDAFIDNDTLYVKDIGIPLGGGTREINANTGMVGVPEIMPNGVRVRVMIDNTIKIGRRVNIKSEINPAANGIYWISKIAFEVASREEPFWYVIECFNEKVSLNAQAVTG